MKLQQLRFLLEIKRQQFNISRAALSLCTSQSGISKQIQLLEEELGISVFIRSSRQLLGFTEEGEQVARMAEDILARVEDIRSLSEERNQLNQELKIATTHTQARYVLPEIVKDFVQCFPDIKLHIYQGTPEQIALMLEQGSVDIAIATEVLSDRESLVAMPYYQWSRSLILPPENPLTEKQSIELEDIVRYPIITYVKGFTGRSKIDEVFERHHLTPNYILTAADADVIKTYVRLGLGIGIVANMAVSPVIDMDLKVVDASRLFGYCTSFIAIKKDKYIKSFVYRFIEMLSPALDKNRVQQFQTSVDMKQRQEWVHKMDIPVL